MKVAIVGSRDYPHMWKVLEYVNSLEPGTVVISGGASGVDTTAEIAALARGMGIIIYRPDWSTGRDAGLKRNRLIVEAADAVVAFWDGKSRGTAHTISVAQEMGKPVRIIVVGEATL